ncbi:MAG: hypothetical protein QQN63_02580 [Nitrosopumilus sp.]
MKGDEQMDLLDLLKSHAVADKAQGVIFGSAAVQVISNYATEITLAITFVSFIIMWFYKHKTSERDKAYKHELLRIKKGEYSKYMMRVLKENSEISPEQLLKIQKDIEDESNFRD